MSPLTGTCNWPLHIAGFTKHTYCIRMLSVGTLGDYLVIYRL